MSKTHHIKFESDHPELISRLVGCSFTFAVNQLPFIQLEFMAEGGIVDLAPLEKTKLNLDIIIDDKSTFKFNEIFIQKDYPYSSFSGSKLVRGDTVFTPLLQYGLLSPILQLNQASNLPRGNLGFAPKISGKEISHIIKFFEAVIEDDYRDAEEQFKILKQSSNLDGLEKLKLDQKTIDNIKQKLLNGIEKIHPSNSKFLDAIDALFFLQSLAREKLEPINRSIFESLRTFCIDALLMLCPISTNYMLLVQYPIVALFKSKAKEIQNPLQISPLLVPNQVKNRPIKGAIIFKPNSWARPSIFDVIDISSIEDGSVITMMLPRTFLRFLGKGAFSAPITNKKATPSNKKQQEYEDKVKSAIMKYMRAHFLSSLYGRSVIITTLLDNDIVPGTVVKFKPFTPIGQKQTTYYYGLVAAVSYTFSRENTQRTLNIIEVQNEEEIDLIKKDIGENSELKNPFFESSDYNLIEEARIGSTD